MAITNLTGTKWKLNDGFTAPAGYGIFSVNFNFQTEYSTASESGLYVGYHWGTEGPAEAENMCCVAYEDFNPGTLIEFTGGADTTNTNLITWIQANATQIITPIQVNMTKSSITLATEGTYCDKDIQITAALQEKTITPTTAAQDIIPDTGNVGLSKVVVGAVPTQIKDITLTTVESTDILPDAGKFLSKVMVSPRLQNKTFYPAEQTEGGTVWADEGYAGLESVEITGIELEEKTATENGVVVPYAGRFLSKVTVNVPSITDVATAAEMDAKLIEANDGRVYRFTGTTDSKYTNGDLYEVVLTLISFSIGGTSYQAVEGMTWGDWLASKYNTADYYEDTSSGRVCINMDGMEWNVYDDDGTAQTTGMVIQSGYAYGQW